MLFYTIPPVAHLDLMHLGTAGYYCLAHLYLKNISYRDFFKDRVKENKFVTLDNSAAERSLVTEDILIDIVKDLQPSEVIAPDFLLDKNKTLISLDRFIRRMIKENLIDKTKIFACPQGNTREEWLECYGEALINPYVKVIGLSKIAVPWCFSKAKNDEGIAKARQKCLKHLISHDLIEKPIHCLGQGNYTEFHYKHPLIRSTDSCYQIFAALNGIEYGKGKFKRIPTNNDYFNTTLTKEQLELAIKNIKFFKEYLWKNT